MTEKTILVVEDNALNMKLIRAILKMDHYRVIEASDAETGIRLAGERRPDLILMDIQLPGMDGLSATQMIKADPGLKGIPIFAMSGFDMEDDKKKMMDIGFADYIIKPIQVKGLLEAIAHVFND